MPRRARIGAGGALQDIICQGIERRYIFRDDNDRPEFLGRLGGALKETQSVCTAWALIPNQFHVKGIGHMLGGGDQGGLNRRSVR